MYIVIGSPFAAYLADMDIYRLSSKADTYEERPRLIRLCMLHN